MGVSKAQPVYEAAYYSDVQDGGPFLRSPYNYDMEVASRLSGLACVDPTRAQQQFQEEVDINTIVKRFNLTGKMPDNIAMPQYGDFADALDYQSSLNAVIAAQDEFMRVPAHVRARFHNDPAALISFLGDESNRAEAERLGLVKPAEPVVVPVSAVVSPPVDGSGV